MKKNALGRPGVNSSVIYLWLRDHSLKFFSFFCFTFNNINLIVTPRRIVMLKRIVTVKLILILIYMICVCFLVVVMIGVPRGLYTKCLTITLNIMISNVYK